VVAADAQDAPSAQVKPLVPLPRVVAGESPEREAASPASPESKSEDDSQRILA